MHMAAFLARAEEVLDIDPRGSAVFANSYIAFSPDTQSIHIQAPSFLQ